MARDLLPSVPPRDEEAAVLTHTSIAPDHYCLRIQAPYIAEHAQPGQFVQVRVAKGFDPFLRRPLSMSMADPREGWIELVYRVVGHGTATLSQRAVAETVSVLGPLGRAFRLPETGTVVLVGGGRGMPPLHFAAHRLPPERTLVVQGARTASLLLYEQEFEALGVARHWTTEDGTAGVRGLVTEALGAVLDPVGGAVEILSCGPMPMMAAVAQIARERRLPCQVSVEERMACGFGICIGCAVKLSARSPSSPEYALVCLDGPVFDARDIFSASARGSGASASTAR
jgi:dihydroorotate dehydrogenase electron transfer subunit